MNRKQRQINRLESELRAARVAAGLDPLTPDQRAKTTGPTPSDDQRIALLRAEIVRLKALDLESSVL